MRNPTSLLRKSDHERTLSLQDEKQKLQREEAELLLGTTVTIPPDLECPYKVEPKPSNGSAGDPVFLTCGAEKKNKNGKD